MIRRSVTLTVLGAILLGTTEALNCYSCSGSDCINSATIGQQILCNGVSEKCYTKFSGYVPTQRGCWSSLAQTEQNACPGNDCEVCTEDSCNLMSRSTHKCTVCSSVLNEKCVSDPSSLTAAQCGAATLDVTDSQCYSRVIGSVTERGCVQSQSDLDICDGSLCKTCTGENCNNGVYPADRQKCVKCTGAACNAATDTGYCDNPSESCVSVRRSDGTVAKNCESSLAETDKSICQTNSASCSYCVNNECNKGTVDFSASRRCYTCQGTDCLRSSVEIKACQNVDDVCFSLFDGFNPVRRGCKAELSSQDKDVCDDADDVSCELCLTDGCNLNSRQDHQCHYCSSVINGQCITNPNSVVRCPAPTTEVSEEAQCYTRVIGMVTERGCLGTPAADIECKSSENCQMCAIEDGAACNTGIFPADRIKCVVNTASDQYCPNPHDSCVQIMQGITRSKKCQSSMTDAEVSFCQANSNKCDFCTGNNCNAQDKTFNYLECVSCTSSNDPGCIGNALAISSVVQCTTCVTIYSSAVVRRGCLSSLTTQEQQQCSTQSSTCSTCSTNRCNTAVHPADRLACYTCQEGSCFSHDSIKLEYCPTYQQGDSCMIQMDSSGKLVRLGCKSALSSTQAATCNANADLCKTCTRAGCNQPSKYLPRSSCVQCSSAHDPDCIGKASKLDAEPCSDPLNTQCYSRLLTSSVTERGCVNDLDSAALALCARGTDCSLCSSPTGKCNSLEYPDGWRRCFQCDSTQDSACKNAQTGTAPYCATYSSSDQCYTIVQQDGRTIRKCSPTNPAECAGSSRCEVCLFNECNNRISTDITPTVSTTMQPPTSTRKPNPASRPGNSLLAVLLSFTVAFCVRRTSFVS
ncbi:prion-like-(Q/N-rich) domain-bearing protein 25 [Wyeomyia smithii]|uniref:prion-like-(Q/N-rich) domain-bearing protein 25 n=1 Tax=Wyeomyia smithii TaxID=174621 RepID=UPI00246807B7|nr:prion-like-(Q/N-rich) domain-bearing protein 25 [Wyeomyia smithii]